MDSFNLSQYLRGEVVDIGNSSSILPDKILFDTNVLYFCYYVRFGLGKVARIRKYQKSAYPHFLQRLLQSGATLFVNEIVLMEFISLIKKSELELLYCKKNNTLELPANLDQKGLCYDYPKEYFTIQRRLATYLNVIMKTFKLVGQHVSIDHFLSEFLLKWQDSFADVGDVIINAEGERGGVDCVLSDDACFATMENVNLYTANPKAINAYKAKATSS
jgi:predicted nucleic-acid-binding protein